MGIFPLSVDHGALKIVFIFYFNFTCEQRQCVFHFLLLLSIQIKTFRSMS